VIDKLADAANRALKSDDVVAKLRAQGFEPLGSTPEEFAELIAHDAIKWAAAAQAAGLKK
jgi:tripartite-type tricarboxylate transporter receptor subunit TctC